MKWLSTKWLSIYALGPAVVGFATGLMAATGLQGRWPTWVNWLTLQPHLFSSTVAEPVEAPLSLLRITAFRQAQGSLAASAVVVLTLVAALFVCATLWREWPFRAAWLSRFQKLAPLWLLGGMFGGGLALAYDTNGMLVPAAFLISGATIVNFFRPHARNGNGHVEILQSENGDLGEINWALFETLATVIDVHQIQMFGHSAQVAVYAGALAKQMGLSPDEQDLLIQAALLHDIGKVAISETILGKPGRLTDEEYSTMQRHSTIGAEILRPTKELCVLAPLVKHHHERWDGSGYPDGLKGKEIPLGARILCVADSVDAMFSTRPYRRARSHGEVMAEVTCCSGTQFDPTVVKALMAIDRAEGRNFFRNSATTTIGTSPRIRRKPKDARG